MKPLHQSWRACRVRIASQHGGRRNRGVRVVTRRRGTGSTGSVAEPRVASSTLRSALVVAGHRQGWGKPALRMRDVPEEQQRHRWRPSPSVTSRERSLPPRASSRRPRWQPTSRASSTCHGRRGLRGAVGGLERRKVWKIRHRSPADEPSGEQQRIVHHRPLSLQPCGPGAEARHVCGGTVVKATARRKARRWAEPFGHDATGLGGAPTSENSWTWCSGPSWLCSTWPATRSTRQRWLFRAEVDRSTVAGVGPVSWARGTGTGDFLYREDPGGDGARQPRAVCRMWQDLLRKVLDARWR